MSEKHQQLKEQIRVVAGARETTRKAVEERNRLLAEWTETNKEVFTRASDASLLMGEAEEKLRELTLQAYAETGDKAPVIGVGIRERTVLTYDNKVAFDWAKAHKMALKLDTSAFEKIAKASPPEFVKITTEPQATIATQLEVIE